MAEFMIRCSECGLEKPEREMCPADGEGGLELCLVCEAAGDPTRLVRYTAAPEAYDGFETVTLQTYAASGSGRRIWRAVAIRPEHLEWQTARYASGMHACLTEARFQDLTA